LVRHGFTETNLALINTDADRFMKLAAPVKITPPAVLMPMQVASPTALAVGLPALGISDATAKSTFGGRPSQAGPSNPVLVGGAGDDLQLGQPGRDLLIGGFGGAARTVDGDDATSSGITELDSIELEGRLSVD
jgi:hypothetical protein